MYPRCQILGRTVKISSTPFGNVEAATSERISSQFSTESSLTILEVSLLQNSNFCGKYDAWLKYDTLVFLA